MKKRVVWFLVIFLLMGCQSARDQGQGKVYDIQGKITGIDPDKKKITLDHEDIPGFMQAMEMKFPVENAGILEGLQPGDKVRGKLRVQGGAFQIVELKKQ